MPGYQTQQTRVEIVGAAALQIRSLLDRQQFSDPLGAAARLGISSATWPLFGLLWPSGAHLAAHLAANLAAPLAANLASNITAPLAADPAEHALQPGRRILEVGCGLALASLVGHRCGADMTASDCHPLAAEFLRANLALNGLLPMKYRHGEWDGRLEGGAQQERVSQRYELIIGSDVLYDRDASAALAGFIGRHATPDSEVWIVDPERGNRPAFTRSMAMQGYALEQTRLDTAATAAQPAYRGRLLTYRRSAAEAAVVD